MWWKTKPSPHALPEPELAAWMRRAWAWLLLQLRGGRGLGPGPALRPLPDDLPIPTGQGHELALAISAFVQQRAQLQGWPCQLLPQAADGHRDIAMATGAEYRTNGAAGTFQLGRDRVAISYDPDQLNELESFIALMAHEWSHYLLATVAAARPGGPEAEEPLTDLCAIYLGFGVFQANAAFVFRQRLDDGRAGWRTRSLGYLGQRGSAYGLALHLATTETSLRRVKGHLAVNPRTWVAHGLRDLERNHAQLLAHFREGALSKPYAR